MGQRFDRDERQLCNREWHGDLGQRLTAKSGTVSFAANQTTATITVNTTDDSTVESPETMTVTLSNGERRNDPHGHRYRHDQRQ